MKDIAISVQGVGKEYSISKGKNSFWALKDVNLEVERGKVLGLIGPNGAGKSTLLKVLSRITYPTQGQVKVNGRLSSLLEVGTGFHPELTGRENIYLNGAILGMTRKEIDLHFEEIMDFSGVHKFIDTPVKHYSSGMYVRLAFSVAAHLDSDILLIDEVLAVGDVEFQRKCLEKMSEATQAQNRTVIFVSHNMGIARNLCDEIAYLDKGQIMKIGDSVEISDYYLQALREVSESVKLSDRTDRKGNGEGKLVDLKIYDPNSGRESVLICGEAAVIEVFYESAQQDKIGNLNFELNIFNDDGNFLLTLGNQFSGYAMTNVPGKGSAKCVIPKLPLMAGRYFFKAHLHIDNKRADFINRTSNFEVLEGDYYDSGVFYKRRLPGVFIEQNWDHQNNI